MVKPEEQDWALLARDLALKLALAISSAPASAGFYTRWMIIQSRLERLAQSLHGLSPKSGSCLGLIQSIVDTLKLVQNAQASPPAGQGKLQAQSNLDAIVARIDSHVAALATVAHGSAVDCDSDLKGLVASLQLHGGVREAALRRLLRRLRHVADGASAAAAMAQLGALPILARIAAAAAANDRLRDDALDALLLTLPFAAPEATFAPLARMVELGSSSDKALLAIRSLVSSSPSVAALAAARPRLVARMCSMASNTSGIQPAAPQVAARTLSPGQPERSTAISCKPSSKKGSLQLLRALQLLRNRHQKHRPERVWAVKLFRGRKPIRSLLTA